MSQHLCVVCDTRPVRADPHDFSRLEALAGRPLYCHQCYDALDVERGDE